MTISSPYIIDKSPFLYYFSFILMTVYLPAIIGFCQEYVSADGIGDMANKI